MKRSTHICAYHTYVHTYTYVPKDLAAPIERMWRWWAVAHRSVIFCGSFLAKEKLEPCSCSMPECCHIRCGSYLARSDAFVQPRQWGIYIANLGPNVGSVITFNSMAWQGFCLRILCRLIEFKCHVNMKGLSSSYFRNLMLI